MEDPDPYGLCALVPHPTTLPHYITTRDGLPVLCALSEQLSRQGGLGWAGMPKCKPKKYNKPAVRKRRGENRQQARARVRKEKVS